MMDGPKPTTLQRFFAGPWPTRIWFLGWSIGFPVALIHSADIRWSQARWSQVNLWPDIPYFIFVSLILAAVGFLCGAIAGSIVLPIPFYIRARINGAPYEPGDRILIIHGPHSGTISTVTDHCHPHVLRVDLGPRASVDDADTFSPLEVIRVQ